MDGGDSGSVVGSDSGTTESDGSTADAEGDGGAAGGNPGSSGGCGCVTVGAHEAGLSPSLVALGVIAMAGAVGARRRRSRRSPSGSER